MLSELFVLFVQIRWSRHQINFLIQSDKRGVVTDVNTYLSDKMVHDHEFHLAIVMYMLILFSCYFLLQLL